MKKTIGEIEIFNISQNVYTSCNRHTPYEFNFNEDRKMSIKNNWFVNIPVYSITNLLKTLIYIKEILN